MENSGWNYDYVRLAWDSGFCFDNSKGRTILDWSSVGLVDVDKVVADRDIAIIEKFIPIILQFSLSEELAKILEPNFVKIFKLGQLSLQYMIFCKKYLDNTVFLLKKELANAREEHNKWSAKEADYKEQIRSLRHINKELKSSLEVCPSCPENTFTCPECNKVFASQEFLNGHIKRRHEVNELLQNETDKLQMEIKQLKEQLNASEKFGKVETISNTEVKSNESSIKEHNSSRIRELQDKFDRLKYHVENELKHVNDQKFYLEKCEKWMELAFLKLGSPRKSDELQEKVVKIIEPKSNTSTQTTQNEHFDLIYETNKQKEHVEEHLNEIFKLQDEIKKDTLNQIGNFELKVQEKVSNTLQKLENQMSLFWVKLSELSLDKKQQNIIEKNDYKPEERLHIEVDLDAFRMEKPLPKPRKIKPKFDRKMEDRKNLEDLARSGFEFKQNNKVASPRFQQKVQKSEMSGDFYPASNFSVQNVNVQKVSAQNLPKFVGTESDLTVTEEESVSLVKNEDFSTSSSVYSKESLKEDSLSLNRSLLRKDLETAVYEKLKEVGVSEKWKGLPVKSFEKAIKLIRHQASIISKTYPEYSNVKGKIVKDVEAQVKSHKKKRSKHLFKSSESVKPLPITSKEDQTNKLESKTSKIDSKASKIDTKFSKIDNRGSKIDTKASKIDFKSSKVDFKGSKIDTRNSKIDTRNSKIETKSSKTENQINKAENKFNETKPQNVNLESTSNITKKTKNQGVTSMYASSSDISTIQQEIKPFSSAIHLFQQEINPRISVESEIDRKEAALKSDMHNELSMEQKQSFLTELKQSIDGRKEKTSSISDEIELAAPVQTKSLLKTSTSISKDTLAKKKVLFDLESISAMNIQDINKEQLETSVLSPRTMVNVQEKPENTEINTQNKLQAHFAKLKAGDSESTSIGSSVLELEAARAQTPRKSEEKAKTFDEDGSDWDISDLLMNN